MPTPTNGTAQSLPRRLARRWRRSRRRGAMGAPRPSVTGTPVGAAGPLAHEGCPPLSPWTQTTPSARRSRAPVCPADACGRGKGPARGTGLHALCGAHGLAPVGTFERHACMHALPAASCVRRARGWCAGQPGQACDGIMPLAHLPCQPCDDLNVQGLISSSPSQQRHRHAWHAWRRQRPTPCQAAVHAPVVLACP